MIHFYARHANRTLTFALIALGFNLLTVATTGNVAGFSGGLCLLVVSLLLKSRALVSLGVDRIESRPGPLRSKRIQSLVGLVSVGPLTDDRLILVTEQGALDVPVRGLSDGDRGQLVQLLEDRLPRKPATGPQGFWAARAQRHATGAPLVRA